MRNVVVLRFCLSQPLHKVFVDTTHYRIGTPHHNDMNEIKKEHTHTHKREGSGHDKEIRGGYVHL